MNAHENPSVLVVAGPTASGKSALALAVAEEFGGTVINADSMQVYRELRILTARPGAEAEARAPHRLYGVLAADDPCSAGRWRSLAVAEIAAAQAAGRLPIVVGGTGLYIKALIEGISDIPAIPAAARAAARALFDEIGEAAFRGRLADLDGFSNARIAAGDRQRLIRAFEVVTATGRPLGDWHSNAAGPGLRFGVIVLMPPRDALYAACDARVDAMLAAGALAEARAIMALGLDPALPVMKVLGLGDLTAHLQGEIDLATARLGVQKATRNYAKRQLTWLRNQIATAERVNAQYSESLNAKIFSFIRNSLLTAQR